VLSALAVISQDPDVEAFTGGLEVGIYACMAVIAVVVVISTVRKFLG
jgi:hypothetical protein